MIVHLGFVIFMPKMSMGKELSFGNGCVGDIPWILGGDFNMIENQEDKHGGIEMDWKGNDFFLDENEIETKVA